MEELKKQRDAHITKIFWLGFQIAFIFAIPAILGVFIGRNIDFILKTGNKITISILFLTFIFSWFLLIVKYKKLNKKLKEINQAIKEESSKN